MPLNPQFKLRMLLLLLLAWLLVPEADGLWGIPVPKKLTEAAAKLTRLRPFGKDRGRFALLPGNKEPAAKLYAETNALPRLLKDVPPEFIGECLDAAIELNDWHRLDDWLNAPFLSPHPSVAPMMRTDRAIRANGGHAKSLEEQYNHDMPHIDVNA